jgi:hypothetical protein
MTTWEDIRDRQLEEGYADMVREELAFKANKKTRLLGDACEALDHCFQRLGYGNDDIESLLSDELFAWWHTGRKDDVK